MARTGRRPAPGRAGSPQCSPLAPGNILNIDRLPRRVSLGTLTAARTTDHVKHHAQRRADTARDQSCYRADIGNWRPERHRGYERAHEDHKNTETDTRP